MKSLILLTFCLISMAAFAGENCKLIIEKKSNINDFNYVIVPGIFDEYLPAYMTEYKDFLRKLGVSRSQVRLVKNWSVNKPVESSLRLLKRIKSMSKDKPFVFFAHSKGALEVLYLLLNNEEIMNRTYRAVLIQGPLDGISSYELFYSDELSDEVRGDLFVMLSRYYLSFDFIEERYQEFSKESVRAQLNPELLNSPTFLEKITYVVGATETSNMRRNLRFFGNLYKRYYGDRSDGVIREVEQLPYGLDTEKACILHEEVDHRDLVIPGSRFSSRRHTLIHSFIDKIMF